MNKSTTLITTTKVFFVQTLSYPTINHVRSFCSLKWKRRILWVSHANDRSNHLAALENLQWLKKCLSYSSANLVCIDLSLGESEIKLWADACKQANKKLFVRLTSGAKRSKSQLSISRLVKGFFDRITAALLLLLLSPFFLIISLKLKSKGSIFSRDWEVGKGGRLFQSIKFRTGSRKISKYSKSRSKDVLCRQNDDAQVSLLDRWIQNYGLDTIPQLINVLWGEMSIVGPKALTLNDAVQMNFSKYRYYPPVLPGIISPFQLKINSSSFEHNQINHLDHEYLQKWNLMKDIKTLLKALLKLPSIFYHKSNI